ncbi:response regulator [Halopseudomonas nanhaiensis]|uniref:hybrid sensor histidine kinase/response regulator n=1 Tax=Halopseudomonas nanhaiensis TaxID=2830842 RepID=UPI001CBF23CA|nr:hybrid sensor histidine kinase/response regulator [Halopseudomonas nanhaiensis]UAW98676.1 response regulator [Halopseudomonas nanhaiensis]
MTDKQLLIVDDNAATRYAMRRRLESHGYTVIEAGTGTDGLALLGAQDIDALILDINLPDMSGFDIARRLRADTRTALLPIVHVSAASIESGDIITGLDSGADAYLIHPIDPDVLLATLRTLLRVRQTEVALQEREAHFREIFHNISAPIAVIDSNFTVHEANRAFSRLITDSRCGEALGHCFAPGQDSELETVRARILAGKRWTGTLKINMLESERLTQWQVAPYRAPDIAMVFVEDVTVRHQKEVSQREQLATANDLLAQEVRERVRTEAQLLQARKMDSLGKLTGGIAHDFNNLLTNIIMSLQLLSERMDQGRTENLRRYADGALASAQSGAALTHRLLAFARQQPLEARPVDINTLLGSLEELLGRSIGKHITLTFDLAAGEAVAQVDASQLEAALLNLVINARDALPEGGEIRISSAMIDIRDDAELADGRYVKITVHDNGIGIDADVIDKVFDPFFTTKPLGHGTGLGLSMLYGFAGQSGGIARIVSEAGEFTEVTLLLPAGAPAIDAAQPDTASAGQGRTGSVLIVEDVVAVSAIIAERLTEAGYQCTQTDNVENALALLRGDGPIDILLTDVGLPRMNGRELAEAARRLRPGLPVLFMTGYTEQARERDSFVAHDMDILFKPFNVEELLGKFARLLPGQ